MSKRRLSKPGLPREGQPMRDLIKGVRAPKLVIAALQGDYRRDPRGLSTPGEWPPRIRWRGPGGLIYESEDPESLPEPLRQAVRAQLIGVFSLSCPVCAAPAVWVTEAQVAAADVARLQVERLFAHERAPEWVSDWVFAIEHLPECPARPAHLELLRGLGSN